MNLSTRYGQISFLHISVTPIGTFRVPFEAQSTSNIAYLVKDEQPAAPTPQTLLKIIMKYVLFKQVKIPSAHRVPN